QQVSDSSGNEQIAVLPPSTVVTSSSAPASRLPGTARSRLTWRLSRLVAALSRPQKRHITPVNIGLSRCRGQNPSGAGGIFPPLTPAPFATSPSSLLSPQNLTGS